MDREFDLLSMGEILLRLSPPDNERIVRGDTFVKQPTGLRSRLVVSSRPQARTSFASTVSSGLRCSWP